LDLSLNGCGFACFDRSKRKKLIDWGTIPNNHFDTSEEGKKLSRIEAFLMTLRISYYPAEVVIEEWVPNSPNAKTNIQSSYKLGGVHGIVKKIWHDQEIQSINNKTLKKQFTGNGNAEKQDVIDRVYEIKDKLVYKAAAECFTVRGDDDSDAIALGVCHLQNTGEWK
jgi:Holliday junction resolvasome RuvABC endonuclease subunit